MRPSTGASGFEEAFRDVFPAARRVAGRVLGDQALAEDAAAEAFARALASWRRVGSLPYRDAWLLRVTANVAIDMARKRQRGASIPQPSPAGTVSDDQADAAATRLALVAALSALPRRQREVVALRYLADLSEAAVAECLGVHVGTVQQHAHRGIRALRERLGPSIEEVHLVSD